MMFQNKEDIPRAVWGNPNPKQAELGGQPLRRLDVVVRGRAAVGRVLDPPGRELGHDHARDLAQHLLGRRQQQQPVRHAVSPRRLGHLGHDGSRLVQRPGRPAQPLGGAGAVRGLAWARSTRCARRSAWASSPTPDVLRLNRNGLAQSGLAVADVIARAVNADPLPAGVRAGVQVYLDGAAPVDKEPACDVNTNPLCDGGGPAARGPTTRSRPCSASATARIEPDNGVLVSKNKTWNSGSTRGTEGSQCGYNCFTWVEDAHPEDMNTGRLLQARRHARHAHGGRLPAAQRRAVPRGHELGLLGRVRRRRRTTCTSTSSTSTSTPAASSTTSSASRTRPGRARRRAASPWSARRATRTPARSRSRTRAWRRRPIRRCIRRTRRPR